MAITYLGSNTGTIDDAGSVSLTGLSLQQDDIVVVAIASDDELDPGSGDGITTAGYAHVIETANNVSNPGCRFSWKRMGATPDTSVVIQTHGDLGCVIVKAFRGVDTTTAMDVAGTQANASTGMPDPPAIDPVTAGCMCVIAGLLDDDVITATAPANYTTDFVTHNDGVGASVMMGHRLLATADIEDPAAFGGGGNDEWRAGTMALRPAAEVVAAQPATKRWGGVPFMALNRGVW